VVIAVEERFPFVAVAADQGWSILDSSGQPVRDVLQQPRKLPVISGGPQDWQPVFAALVALDEATRSRVATASADESGTVELTLRESRRSPAATIDWGRSERNEEKARVLVALLRLRASAYTVAVPERPAVSEDAVLPRERKSGRTPAPSSEPTPDLE
jgi:cell division septal protein FtsQ